MPEPFSQPELEESEPRSVSRSTRVTEANGLEENHDRGVSEPRESQLDEEEDND